jgi:regulator of nonsense transcripts 2
MMVGNGQNNDNGAEENGVQDNVNDGEHDSGSDVIDVEGHDDDELDEENHDDGCETEDDDEDEDGPASDDEDEVHVRQKVAEVDPLEEADFDQELKAVVQASVYLFYHMCTCS